MLKFAGLVVQTNKGREKSIKKVLDDQVQVKLAKELMLNKRYIASLQLIDRTKAIRFMAEALYEDIGNQPVDVQIKGDISRPLNKIIEQVKGIEGDITENPFKGRQKKR